MSNIVEPQIVETKPSWFSDYIKNNPNIIGNTSSTPVLCKDGTTQNQLSSPNAKYADACINNGGRAVVQQNTLDAKNQLAQQQALLLTKSNERLTAEDKLYEKLGIKYHNTHMFGVASRMKGRFLLALVLIGGYIAYKKFKK